MSSVAAAAAADRAGAALAAGPTTAAGTLVARIVKPAVRPTGTPGDRGTEMESAVHVGSLVLSGSTPPTAAGRARPGEPDVTSAGATGSSSNGLAAWPVR